MNFVIGCLFWKVFCMVMLVLIGVFFGLFSGLFGVGGGFVIVFMFVEFSDVLLCGIVVMLMVVIVLVLVGGVLGVVI